LTPESPQTTRRTVAEVLIVFAIATALASLLYHAPGGWTVIHNNLHALVALVFLGLPQVMLRRRGNIEKYGFTWQPLGLGLGIAALAIVVVLPLFALGFVALLRLGCVHLPEWVPGACWQVTHPAWRLPPGFALSVPAQLIVIALPEELFFRGYVQGRLDEAWPPRRTLWGAPVGRAFWLQALLFGLGHYLVSFEPQMLTRFFPALAFGWMYARTRSILAGVLFHAASNLLMAVLGASLLS
jgi:membrane protease YdiL (CAAX protease family)